ncbi:MAG: hypothetical protein ABIK28_21490 [Planctomycetota bacterium]
MTNPWNNCLKLMVCCALFLFLLSHTGPVKGQDLEDMMEEFNFLFIHHSVGGNWLHSQQGQLRLALENPAYNDYIFEVHDATYGDTIGEDTDVCHWLPKFQNQMDLVLTFDYHTDNYYTDPSEFNQIVMFKSCYPASDIDEEGVPPGDPTSSDKTIWNYRAAYRACGSIFASYPQILFVIVTAPPRNRYSSAYDVTRGTNACIFNQWMKDCFVDDYRLATGLNNVVVFDLFGDVLAEPITDPTAPGALKEMFSSGGTDSHPNVMGSKAATITFIPFINRVVKEWHYLFANKNRFKVSQPDEVKLFLFSEPDYAGDVYLMLGSLSGAYPGATIGDGYHLPLNVDEFSNWTVLYSNSSFFPNFTSTLNLSGRGLAGVKTTSPLPAGFIGLTMHFAYVILFPIQFVSNAVPISFEW